MTADGTYRFARAGESELEQMPVGSVLVHPFDPAWTLTRGAYTDGQPWGGSDGKRWSSENAHVNGFTVLFRPDAPQPATTGDAIERAARAHEVSLRGGGDMPDEVWVRQRDRYGLIEAMRAALAAAGAGAEVDREALVKAMQNEIEYRIRTAAALAKGGHSVQDEVNAGRARIAVLAARGDATAPTLPGPLTVKFDGGRRSVLDESNRIVGYLTGDVAPTEIEWGVRWPNSDVEKCGAPGTADDYEDESVAEHGGVRVQRTVSAWREAEVGKQRG